MNTLKNPPAFACASALGLQEGMTLRDFFAAQALPSVMEDKRYSDCGNEAANVFEVARYAGKIADAMLAERSREDRPQLLKDCLPELHKLCNSWLKEAKDDNGDPADVARSVIYAHCARELAALLKTQ